MTFHSCDEEGRTSILVGDIRISPVSKQDFDHRMMTFLTCDEEGRTSILVGDIRISPVSKEDVDDRKMTFLTCDEEGRTSILVGDIRISPVSKQDFDHRMTTIKSCPEQRSTTIAVLHIDLRFIFQEKSRSLRCGGEVQWKSVAGTGGDGWETTNESSPGRKVNQLGYNTRRSPGCTVGSRRGSSKSLHSVTCGRRSQSSGLALGSGNLKNSDNTPSTVWLALVEEGRASENDGETAPPPLPHRLASMDCLTIFQ
ncbi:unnamed protein product [Cyprideis torosa]|uniref:Uncharacterized protein n=1 Tax=Cyprideis torosa TaxID=163714 RepID=A0A7R8WNF1_9CRUS|nr:unnamed protein product [Cyprideis torosa]CAG0903970.1 unnamed protein product [Cyprideis torosa]